MMSKASFIKDGNSWKCKARSLIRDIFSNIFQKLRVFKFFLLINIFTECLNNFNRKKNKIYIYKKLLMQVCNCFLFIIWYVLNFPRWHRVWHLMKFFLNRISSFLQRNNLIKNDNINNNVLVMLVIFAKQNITENDLINKQLWMDIAIYNNGFILLTYYARMFWLYYVFIKLNT